MINVYFDSGTTNSRIFVLEGVGSCTMIKPAQAAGTPLWLEIPPF